MQGKLAEGPRFRMRPPSLLVVRHAFEHASSGLGFVVKFLQERVDHRHCHISVLIFIARAIVSPRVAQPFRAALHALHDYAASARFRTDSCRWFQPSDSPTR